MEGTAGTTGAAGTAGAADAAAGGAPVKRHLVLSVDVGRKNLALCVLHAGEDARGANDTIVQWAVVSCEPTPEGIRGAMAGMDLEGVTEAVIERQPPRNPTMCRLQHYIEMFCVLRGLQVVVQDAKHKLAFAASTPWWPPGDLASWTYHTRKKVSVQTATAFLDAVPQRDDLAKTFLRSRKKDDFADSLLQGMAYCHHVRVATARAAAATETVRPRKPTEKQLASGRLSKAGIAYMLSKNMDHVALAKCMQREFGSAEAARRACGVAN